jgi:hypothetical protein
MARYASERPPARTRDMSGPDGVQVMDKFADGYLSNDYVEVWLVGAEETASGIEVNLGVSWQRNFACMGYYVVIRRGGQYLGHAKVEGGPTVWSDCRYDVTVPVPGAASSDRLEVALYPDVATVSEIKSGARDPAYSATIYPSTPERTKVEESTGEEGGSTPFADEIQDATTSALAAVATPALTFTGLGLAAYVAWQSRASIANATQSIIKNA